jgi:hypothetical protein
VRQEGVSEAGDTGERVELGESLAAGNAVAVVIEGVAVRAAVLGVVALVLAFASAGLLARRAEEGTSACVDILET